MAGVAHRGVLAWAFTALVTTAGACDPASWGAQPDATPESTPEPAREPTRSQGAAEGAASAAGADVEAPSTVAAAEGEQRQVLEATLARSRVAFYVSRAPSGHEAHFEQYTAKLGLEAGAPRSLEITLRTASVQADAPGLTRHLRSPDFFDSDRYPTATFTSTAIEPIASPDPGGAAEEGGPTHRVRGKLQIKAVTREVAFDARVLSAAGRVEGEATLEIVASEYGMHYPGLEEELADERVSLEVSLYFPR